MLTTDGHLLGGRVRYRQPASGFRSGIEPVLLAASVPARAGEHVLEAGTGAGAALLCLAARVDRVHATGVEIDPEVAALAAMNVIDNGFGLIDIVQGAIETVKLDHAFDHAIANPPYHQPDGSPSPSPGKEIAKRGSATLITGWIKRIGGLLRHRGSLTMILPAGMVPVSLHAMTAAHCPCTALFPFWAGPGKPAKLVLLRGIRDARTPMRLMAGLLLHHDDGSFTGAARAVLDSPTALMPDSS